MTWKYRKKIKIAPGVNVNISRSGVSTTIGPKGASVNIGKNGTYLNTGIPGTGIYDRQKIGGSPSSGVGSSHQSTPGSNAGYDNSGCYWLFGCIIIVGVFATTFRNGFDEFVFVISALGGFALWMLGLFLKEIFKKSSPTEQEEQIAGEVAEEEDAEEEEKVEPLSLMDDSTATDYQGMMYHDWTRENFNLMQESTDNLFAFLKSAGRSIKVRKELDRMMALTNGDGSPWPVNNKITMTMMLDAYRCYTSLGYSLGRGEGEELGLLLFANKVTKPDFNLDYIDLLRYRDQVAPSIRELFDLVITVNSSLPLPEGQYVFQHIFENVDKDRMSQYMVLLYRYASAIAKADGTIDALESEVLANLMKAKDLATDGTPLVVEKKSRAKKNNEGTQSKEESSEGNAEDINPLEQLHELIGLDSVKEEVEKLSNFIKIMKVREERGLPSSPISYHCVFTGNPGTGKTTVARIIAGIYKNLGILNKGQLVETDRSGLIAEYVGQTAVKTNKIIDSAIDGILFIDEAYSLVQGGTNDYGNEAISTLLKRMEDDRDRLVVILAGYSDEMQNFIDSNPGLQSRFNRYINFPDYDSDDLLQIFKKNLEKHQYVMDKDAEDTVRVILENAVLNKDKNFGNARFVRNLFEKTLENQATRLATDTHLTTEKLTTIIAEDIRQQ